MAEFTNTLSGLNAGSTETELSLLLKQVVNSVAETGKKGSITLKLTIERNKRKANLIEMTPEVKSSIPTAPPPSAAYLLHQGELIPLEDTQGRLPFQISQASPQVIEVEDQPQPDEAAFKEIEQ